MSILFCNPSSQVTAPGIPFYIWIMIDGTETINAAQVNISWPSAILGLIGIDHTNSAMPIQAENYISPGMVRMARSIAGGTPPLSGLQEFCKMTFTGLLPGQVVVHFEDTCQIIDPTTFQNVLTTRTDGVYAIQVLDGPPAPPILGGVMPVIQVGAQLQVTGQEPTTNQDGSPLTDLQKIVVNYDMGQGTVVGVEIPATSPSGGGLFDSIFSIPVQGQQANVSVNAQAVDLVGNISLPSQTINLTIDLLAPAPPVI